MLTIQSYIYIYWKYRITAIKLDLGLCLVWLLFSIKQIVLVRVTHYHNLQTCWLHNLSLDICSAGLQNTDEMQVTNPKLRFN